MPLKNVGDSRVVRLTRAANRSPGKRVSFSGAMMLPEVTLAASFSTHVAFSGALMLPELMLAASFSTHVKFSGELALPELTLAASFTPFDPASVTDGLLFNDTAPGALTSWTNLKSSNHATQTDAARKFASNVDGSVQCADVLDSMGWSLVATENNGTSVLAFALWVDPDAIGAEQFILFCWGGTDGTSGFKWDLTISADGSIRVLVFDPLGGFNARALSSAPGIITAEPQFITLEIDTSYGTEATRYIITRELSVLPLTGTNVGTPTVPIVALAPGITGKLIIANGHNSGGGSTSRYAGRLGQYLHSRSGSGRQAGATEGVWNAATRAKLRAVAPLT